MSRWILYLCLSFALIMNQELNAFNIPSSNSKAYKILAGKIGGPGSLDGTGDKASFLYPGPIAIDSSGNIFISDAGNNTIRKITPAGVVTTFAGMAGTSGTTNGTGSAARFNFPQGMAIDSSDNIFLCDMGNNSIRKITPAGVVTTFAGSASGVSGSTNATGTSARFFGPSGIVIDSSGDFYISDTNNRLIRKMTSGGVVTTLAGTAGSTGTADGTGAVARFYGPRGLVIDSSGVIFVVDSLNHNIRKITTAGVVTTFAGSTSGTNGTTNATGTSARFTSPMDITIDASGDFFVTDYSNHAIRKVTAAGVVTTFAGTIGSRGNVNGTGTSARFNSPSGITIDSSGNFIVVERDNNIVRKMTSGGVVTSFVGNSGFTGTANGTGTAAQFNDPQGAAVDATGNIYVADTANHVIRKVTPAGVVTTFAGTMGSSGTTNGTGTAARFNGPTGMAFDQSGNLYVADTNNHAIRKITTNAVVTTFAGTAGTSGATDGTGTAARFRSPKYLVVDSNDNIFVTDSGNGTIRKITPAGVVTTFAGTASSFGSTNGTGSAARFSELYGIGIDSSNNLYVADWGNYFIRKVTPGAVVTTFAGSANQLGNLDGTGTAARFNLPWGVAVDSYGNVYVTDSENNSVRRISPGGVVKTVSGRSTVRGTSMGHARSATLGMVKCIAMKNNVMYLCVDSSILYAPKP